MADAEAGERPRQGGHQLGERSESTHPVVVLPGGVSGAVFVARVVVIHVLSYLVAGAVFSALLDYQRLFQQPVIRDYMLPFGSASLLLSLALQVVRGAVLGLVLVPFRAVLVATRWGWLQLWLLIVGVGIVSTPAAAPSSIEAVIYTRLPLWYHAIGLPEILCQTLIFSWLVHLYLRHPGGLVKALPGSLAIVVRAIVGSCLAFLGYAVFSVTFALVSGVTVSGGQNLGLRTQGMFVVLFVANAVVLGVHLHAITGSVSCRRRLLLGLVIYLSNALLIAAYQAMVWGDVGAVYPIFAPILPALLAAAATASALRDRDSAGSEHG